MNLFFQCLNRLNGFYAKGQMGSHKNNNETWTLVKQCDK